MKVGASADLVDFVDLVDLADLTEVWVDGLVDPFDLAAGDALAAFLIG